jgi:hypothetical protein
VLEEAMLKPLLEVGTWKAEILSMSQTGVSTTKSYCSEGTSMGSVAQIGMRKLRSQQRVVILRYRHELDTKRKLFGSLLTSFEKLRDGQGWATR